MTAIKADKQETFDEWMRRMQYAQQTIVDTKRTLHRCLDLLRIDQPIPSWARAALVRWDAARLHGVKADGEWSKLDGQRELMDATRQSRLGGRRARVREGMRQARSLDDDAWASLLASIRACDEPAARVLEVMAGTGLRVGDVLRISLDALRESERTGSINLVLKGGTPSTLRVDGAAQAWSRLRRTAAQNRGQHVCDLVSPGADSGPAAGGAAYKRVQRLLKELSRTAGISEDVWTHRIRRTVGVQAYRQTEDVLAVRDLLHHRRAATTEGYLSEARPDRVAELQQKVAQRFASDKSRG